MRFKRMELKNWRSFSGTYKINFATDGKKNITVFIGQNGAGKTALLNAFTWVLYGETTAGFRKTKDLFNHTALEAIDSGSSDDMYIELEFDHEGSNYIIRRSITAELDTTSSKIAMSEAKLSAVQKINGITESIGQENINAILPPGLHPFFFFPAENIGKDIDQNDAASIRASMSRAIDILLGIERYDNALKVISKALSSYLKSPQNFPKSEIVSDTEKEMNKAREEWEKADKRKKELPQIIENAQQLENDLSSQLEASDEFNEIRSKLERLSAEIKQEEENISRNREDEISSINRNCAVLFGNEIFSDALDILNKAHSEGKIPPKVSAGLLDELINIREKCICGRSLGDDERKELVSLRSITLEDIIAEIASDLRGRLPSLIENVDGKIDKLSANDILEFDKATVEANSRRIKLQSERKDILENQTETNYSDPAKIREAWKQQQLIVLDCQQELKQLTKDLPELEKAKKDSEKKFGNALDKMSKGKAIRKARGLLSSVEDTLERIQSIVRACARQDVERAMNNFYTPLLLKNYRVSLTEDFHHKIVENTTGKSIGASSSEVALATFAFVGALAALMPVYASLEATLPAGDGKSVGSVKADQTNAYPVVLDAPYSPFGKDYSDQFSKALPDLLPQSILIVREDQLKYVDDLVKEKRIGEAYILQLNSGHADSKALSWLNNNFEYVVNLKEEATSYTKIFPLPVE